MSGARREVRISPRILLTAALACLAVTGCIPPAPEPSPTPQPAPAPPPPAPPPPAPPPPQPAPGDWRDAPQTPGDWRYSSGTAQFGPPGAALLTLRCDRAGGVVVIGRQGSQPQMRILTGTQQRVLDAPAGAAGSIEARVPARDPLLDAMAVTRGRFAVESPGQPTLYVPAWPEVARVVEDCR